MKINFIIEWSTEIPFRGINRSSPIFFIVNFYQLNLSNNTHFIYTFLFFFIEINWSSYRRGLNKNFISLFDVNARRKKISYRKYSLYILLYYEEIFINYSLSPFKWPVYSFAGGGFRSRNLWTNALSKV